MLVGLRTVTRHRRAHRLRTGIVNGCIRTRTGTSRAHLVSAPVLILYIIRVRRTESVLFVHKPSEGDGEQVFQITNGNSLGEPGPAPD